MGSYLNCLIKLFRLLYSFVLHLCNFFLHLLDVKRRCRNSWNKKAGLEDIDTSRISCTVYFPFYLCLYFTCLPLNAAFSFNTAMNSVIKKENYGILFCKFCYKNFPCIVKYDKILRVNYCKKLS